MHGGPTHVCFVTWQLPFQLSSPQAAWLFMYFTSFALTSCGTVETILEHSVRRSKDTLTARTDSHWELAGGICLPDSSGEMRKEGVTVKLHSLKTGKFITLENSA